MGRNKKCLFVPTGRVTLSVKLQDVCLSLQVAWIHIDRQMILTIHRHVIARVPRFSVSHDNQKTWLLHVSGVHQEDRGYYMCQVNTNPMISQVGYLQVVGENVLHFYMPIRTEICCLTPIETKQQKDIQYTYNVTFRRVIATFVAVEKQ